MPTKGHRHTINKTTIDLTVQVILSIHFFSIYIKAISIGNLDTHRLSISRYDYYYYTSYL